MSGTGVRKFYDEWTADFPPGEHLSLDFGYVSVRVRTNSPGLVRDLADYFVGFVRPDGGPADLAVTALEMPEPDLGLEFDLKEPEPGKSRIKEEWVDLPDGRVVRKRLTGMHFLFGGDLNLAVGPCLDNDNQVVNFINNRMIQWDLDRGALLAHAAGVNRHGRGLALAGFAGMGKSTLALHLMSRGLVFVSNDRLLIRRVDGRPFMRGVPKLPRINPGTALNNPDLSEVIPEDEREAFADLDRSQIWDLEHKYDVKISECFGHDRFQLNSPLDGLVILNWQRDAGAPSVGRVNLAQRRDLLGAVMKSPGLFFQPAGPEPDHSEEAYIEALNDTTVIEVSGGVDFERAADACLAFLEER